MKIAIDVPNRTTSEEEISSLMKAVDLNFPEFYRDFLLEQNGGVPVNGIFHYGDGGSSGVVFFGVNTGENYSDLKWNYEVYKDRIPKGFFPIGNDPGGNLICIDFEGDQGVYFGDHEREEQPLSRSNIFKVAESFEEFLVGLEPDEDGEDW
jgi:hypothetical protein